MGRQLLNRMERQGEFIEEVVGFKDPHLKGTFLSMSNGNKTMRYIYCEIKR